MMQEIRRWILLMFTEKRWFLNQHPFVVPENVIPHPSTLKLCVSDELSPSWAVRVGLIGLKVGANNHPYICDQ